MNRRIKVWNYGVAYLSLAIGAGVSVAGNIADTHRIAETSGRTPDGLDIFIAGFWPAAVLLVIEMFVSRLWSPARGPQLIRWSASLTFGFIAAFMSWIHLSDLLASRNQGNTVANLGPLAIDGLAIMATALILSARRRGQDDQDKTPDEKLARMANRLEAAASVQDVSDLGQPLDLEAAAPPSLVHVPWKHFPEAEVDMWARLERDLHGGDSAPISPAAPVLEAPAPVQVVRVKRDSIPATALEMIIAWAKADQGDRPRAGQVDELVGAAHGVSSRTARGWRTALGR